MKFLIIILLALSKLSWSSPPCPIYLSENIKHLKSISKKQSVPWMVRSTALNATPVSKQEVLVDQVFRLSSGLKSKKYKDYTVELTYKYVNLRGARNEAVLKEFKFHNRLGHELDISLLKEIQKNIADLSDESLNLDEIELKNLERKIEQNKNVFYHFRDIGVRDESLTVEIKKTIDEVESLYASLKEISNYDDFSKNMEVYEIHFGEEKISVVSKVNKSSIIEYQEFMKAFLYESKYKVEYRTKKTLSKFSKMEVSPKREQSELAKIKTDKDYEKYKKELTISNMISSNIDGILHLVNYRKGLIILGLSFYAGNKFIHFVKGSDEENDDKGMEEEDIIDVVSKHFTNMLNGPEATKLSEEDYNKLLDDLTLRLERKGEAPLDYIIRQDSISKKVIVEPTSKLDK